MVDERGERDGTGQDKPLFGCTRDGTVGGTDLDRRHVAGCACGSHSFNASRQCELDVSKGEKKGKKKRRGGRSALRSRY